MAVWEYRVVSVVIDTQEHADPHAHQKRKSLEIAKNVREVEKVLSTFGSKGWELVTVSVHSDSFPLLYFKKKKLPKKK